MKIAILGGTGAMGGLYGAYLARAGHDVTLVDVSAAAVAAVNANGLRVTELDGETVTISVKATLDFASVGQVDLILMQVKGMHTESAMRAALPMMGQATTVLTLQNGWGNVDRLRAVVGEQPVMAGTTIHSVTLVGPGHIHHAGKGPTTIGELAGTDSPRLKAIVQTLADAGFDAHATHEIIKVIWSKLALNVCALPTAALLQFISGELVQHEGTLSLMRALLGEVIAVAQAQNISLDFDERWEAILAQLKRASIVKASMMQDVAARRRTEIDTINGAIVEAGQRLGIPTPHNNAMLWMVQALQETF